MGDAAFCDWCGAVAPLEQAQGWTALTFHGLEPQDDRALDFCSPLHAALFFAEDWAHQGGSQPEEVKSEALGRFLTDLGEALGRHRAGPALAEAMVEFAKRGGADEWKRRDDALRRFLRELDLDGPPSTDK